MADIEKCMQELRRHTPRALRTAAHRVCDALVLERAARRDAEAQRDMLLRERTRLRAEVDRLKQQRQRLRREVEKAQTGAYRG